MRSFYSLKSFFLTGSSLLLVTLSNNISAVSADLYKFMDAANECKTILDPTTHVQCMLKNNANIKRKTQFEVNRQLEKLVLSQKKKYQAKLKEKFEIHQKSCWKEKNSVVEGPYSEKRQVYCLYENGLELLITIQKNVDLLLL